MTIKAVVFTALALTLLLCVLYWFDRYTRPDVVRRFDKEHELPDRLIDEIAWDHRFGIRAVYILCFVFLFLTVGLTVGSRTYLGKSPELYVVWLVLVILGASGLVRLADAVKRRIAEAVIFIIFELRGGP